MPSFVRLAGIMTCMILHCSTIVFSQPETASIREQIQTFRNAARDRDWPTWWNALGRDAQSSAKERILRDLEAARDGDNGLRVCLAETIGVHPSRVTRLSARQFLQRWFQSFKDPTRTPADREISALELKESGQNGEIDVTLKFQSGSDEHLIVKHEDGAWRVTSPVFLTPDVDLLETPEVALARLKAGIGAASWTRVWRFYAYALRKTFIAGRIEKLKPGFPLESFWVHVRNVLPPDELGSLLFHGDVDESQGARASLEKLGASCLRVERDGAAGARVLDAKGEVVIRLVLEVSQWRLASDYAGVLRDLGRK